MTTKLKLWIPIIAFFFCSCGAAQLNPKASSEGDQAARLFYVAEDLFKSNSYENALKAYQKFLNDYPSDSNADIALMRMATIYSNQKEYDLGRMAYERLTAQHPNSEFVINAQIEIMTYFYRKGKFKEVIMQASKIIARSDSKTYLSRTYEILGDTYMHLKSPREAIYFYQLAGFADDKKIPLKLRTAVDELSEEDVLSLSKQLNDQFLAGYFLFELGRYRVQNQNYKAALNIFSDFTTHYPHHEKINEAHEWIEKINQRLAFKRRLIGVLLPITGPYAAFGNRALKGIQFALDEFNRQGDQPEFEIMVKDTHSDPKTAINAVKQFDKHRVSLIIGPIITSEDAAKEAQIRNIPIITMSQRADIPELGDYVFRFFLTPQMQIDTLVPYVVNELGIKRFAALYPEETYGDTFLKIFRDRVMDYGAALITAESYKPQQTDFASQIKKFSKRCAPNKNGALDSKRNPANRKIRHKKYDVALNFEAIFIPDSADKVALIAPQLAFYDIDNVLLIGTNLWHSDKLISSARNYVQEAIMTDAFYAKDSKSNIQKFISGFEKNYGESPGVIEALAYDAAMMNFYNLSNPEIQSRADLKDALKNLHNFDGVTGNTSFGKNGDAVKKLYLLQVENNRFVKLNRN
jgi:branched-chain amino acid transport system substrate-binding protein